jgi:hypothetical protein
MTTSNDTLQTWRKRPFKNSTGRFFHIRSTLRTLPQSDYHLFRSLFNNLRGVSFNKDAELQNWLDDFFTAKWRILETCPNVGRQS